MAWLLSPTIPLDYRLSIISRTTPKGLRLQSRSRPVFRATAWKKASTGAKIELLLLKELSVNRWQSLARPARKLEPGSELSFAPSNLRAVVERKREDGSIELEFRGPADLRQMLGELAEAPLPPYIGRKPHEQSSFDRERYQTIYARREGAVAAPIPRTAARSFCQPLS